MISESSEKSTGYEKKLANLRKRKLIIEKKKKNRQKKKKKDCFPKWEYLPHISWLYRPKTKDRLFKKKILCDNHSS